MKRLPIVWVYVLVIVAMIFWGMSFVWSSIVFKYYDPVTTVFVRLVISSAILLGALKLTGQWQRVRREDYKLFMISALMNPFLYFLGENYGLKYTSSTISAVIIATIPVFTPLFAWLFIHEKISKLNTIGMLFSFVGVLVMLIQPDLSFGASPKGVAFLLFAVAAAIGYSIYLKKLADRYSAFTIIAVQNLIGIFYFLPLFLIFGWDNFITVKPNFELVSALLQLSVFASSFAFVFYTMGMAQLGVSRTNMFSNFIPVFTAVFSFFILGEAFTPIKIAGMAIVIFGVYMSQLNSQSKLVQVYRFLFRPGNDK